MGSVRDEEILKELADFICVNLHEWIWRYSDDAISLLLWLRIKLQELNKEEKFLFSSTCMESSLDKVRQNHEFSNSVKKIANECLIQIQILQKEVPEIRNSERNLSTYLH